MYHSQNFGFAHVLTSLKNPEDSENFETILYFTKLDASKSV